jgi:hypothetical protein
MSERGSDAGRQAQVSEHTVRRRDLALYVFQI